MAEFVRKAKFKLLYNNVDITVDITKYLILLNYTDNDEGESDGIDLTLEDVDALWRNGWYPQKGAALSLSIGYNDDDKLIDCGTFEIDEIALQGPPDTVTIKALAAGITKAMRTKRSHNFENQTLRQIATYIALKNKLTLIGSIADIRFERMIQYREKDLSFLRRISMEYGYLFSVRDKKLIFTHNVEVESDESVAQIDRIQIKGYSLKDKTSETYKAANVKYHDPNKGEVQEAKVDVLTNADGVTYKQISTEDTIEIHSKAETVTQAEQKATAALHLKNSTQQEGSLTLEGNPILVAGNNFLLTGFGIISGKYYVRKSAHKIDKSGGYVTTIDVKRTETTAAINQTPKTPNKSPDFGVVNLTNKDGVTFRQIIPVGK